jgi:F0F1-type ATP synthase beta subunit
MAEATGRVVQVTGGVVDGDFSGHDLPAVYDAIQIVREARRPDMSATMKAAN